MTVLANEKMLFEGPIFDLKSGDFTLPDGRVVQRYIVAHPGAVLILPVDSEGKLILVQQFRPAVGVTLLEFPAGTLEDKEKIEECAARELVEETGMTAASLEPFGMFYPSPGFCDEKQYLFFATDLTPMKAEMDDDEFIEVVRMSKEELQKALADGRFMDAKSIALFAKAQAMGLI